ncbi:MAG: hypothetical protein WBB76_02220 [Gaiellaceae bacterium]
MLPRRLGVRFALEALFLILLALGAGLADLRPLFIVIVMAAAWLLVALAEVTAERIDRSPLSYLLSDSLREEDMRPQRVFGPHPDEGTVVAPPSARLPMSQSEPVEEVEEEPPSVAEPVVDEPAPEYGEPEAPARRRRMRSFLRRRTPELESAAPSPPRHVKLLPRRSAPEPNRASEEVSDLFGPRSPDEPEETGT